MFIDVSEVIVYALIIGYQHMLQSLVDSGKANFEDVKDSMTCEHENSIATW
jgi:hypothetical protein